MYKQGDKVRIIGNTYPRHCFRIGAEVIVKYNQEIWMGLMVCCINNIQQYICLDDIRAKQLSNNIKVI